MFHLTDQVEREKCTLTGIQTHNLSMKRHLRGIFATTTALIKWQLAFVLNYDFAILASILLLNWKKLREFDRKVIFMKFFFKKDFSMKKVHFEGKMASFRFEDKLVIPIFTCNSCRYLKLMQKAGECWESSFNLSSWEYEKHAC